MEPIRVCIIGSTGHTAYALDGLRQDEESVLVGIAPGSAGENMAGLENAVKTYAFPCERFDGYRDMLDRLKPDIAVIACHYGDHAEVSVEALRRGIHVLTEKPVAARLDDLERVRQAYRQTGVHLAAMFALRYAPWFAAAYEAVRKGCIGQVRLFQAQKSYKLGQRGAPYRERAAYGGTIPWVGSHAVDWMYWIGGERFVSVYASHSTQYNRDHGDLEMSAMCHFTFTHELFGSVSMDYLQPARSGNPADDRLRIVGTEGIVEVRDRKAYLLDDLSEKPRELELLPEQSLFADFIAQVRGRGTCRISAEDSFAVTEACLKARQSADERKLVYF